MLTSKTLKRDEIMALEKYGCFVPKTVPQLSMVYFNGTERQYQTQPMGRFAIVSGRKQQCVFYPVQLLKVEIRAKIQMDLRTYSIPQSPNQIARCRATLRIAVFAQFSAPKVADLSIFFYADYLWNPRQESTGTFF